jgi:hypothetical protein
MAPDPSTPQEEWITDLAVLPGDPERSRVLGHWISQRWGLGGSCGFLLRDGG